MFTCYFVDMIAMSTTTFMIDFDRNIYHVHELHAISQRRHISEYIPHIYIHLHKICFPNGLRKKKQQRRQFSCGSGPPGTRGFEWLRIDV